MGRKTKHGEKGIIPLGMEPVGLNNWSALQLVRKGEVGDDNMLAAVLYPDLSSTSAEGTPLSARHFPSNQHRGQLTQPPAAPRQIASRHCQSGFGEEERQPS